MARLVLALQYWEGDKETALRNARRIADNEPKFRADVEFCFVSRFDCAHDLATIQHVSQKFRTTTYRSTRRGVGWPSGCNDQWFDLMQESVRRSRGGPWHDVDGIFTFEGDCVPVDPDWLDKLRLGWAQALAANKLLMGSWQADPAPTGHVNGNAVFHPLIALKLDLIGCSPLGGWDYLLAPTLRPHWRRSGLIKNLYRSKTHTEKDFLVPPENDDNAVPVLVHGVKDLSVEHYASRHLRGPGSITPADTSS